MTLGTDYITKCFKATFSKLDILFDISICIVFQRLEINLMSKPYQPSILLHLNMLKSPNLILRCVPDWMDVAIHNQTKELASFNAVSVM